ncbi:MAG: hypothetical protein Q8P22_02540, partial [Chloroflexota bacterium]|nr:hypothetical protein [Chloroflexota bacterium]
RSTPRDDSGWEMSEMDEQLAREYGEAARQVVKTNIGESRYNQICDRLHLSQRDRRVLEELMASWRPDYDVQYIVDLCQQYQERCNVTRVMTAWRQITGEAAEISTRRRFVEFGENN